MSLRFTSFGRSFRVAGVLNSQMFFSRTYSSIVIDEDFLPIQPVWSVQDLLRADSQSNASTLSSQQLDKLTLLARLDKPQDSRQSDSLLRDLSQLNHFLITLKNLPLDNVEPLVKIESPEFLDLGMIELTDETKMLGYNNCDVVKHTKRSIENLFLVPQNN